MTKIKDQLQSLGFDEKEIIVYLECLKSKEGLFVSEISEKTEIKRSTVNIVLLRLIKKGLVTHHELGRRKRYTAENPEHVINSFKEILNEIEYKLPKIYSEIKKIPSTKIRLYQGKDGVVKMFNDIFLTIRMSDDLDNEMLSISAIDQMDIAVNNIQSKIEKKRTHHRIKLRILTPDGPLAEKIKNADSNKTLRNTHFFSDKKNLFNISFNIYAGSVSMFNLKGEPVGVIIEDRNLAESMRILFEIIWENTN
jgi:sugar-specific transcriptional regulator TrmB